MHAHSMAGEWRRGQDGGYPPTVDSPPHGWQRHADEGSTAGSASVPAHWAAVRRPASPAAVTPCREYTTGSRATKYPNDARKMLAFCQDCWARLC